MRGPIARATIRTSAVLALRLLAQAGTLLLVARLFGPELFGAFAGIAALAVLLGAASTFGMHLILLREMSRSLRRRGAVLPIALGTTVACGALLLLLYLFIVWFGLQPLAVSLEVVLCIGLAELLLQPLLQLTGVEHQAQGQIARSQLYMNTPMFLRLGAVTLIWATNTPNPLEVYAWAYLGVSVLALVLGLRSLGEPWPAPVHWQLPRRAELRNASGFAVLNLTALGPAELDKTLALRLLPLAAAGVYAASARVIGALVLPVIALLLAALPRLFREAGQTQNTRLLRWMFAATAGYSVAVSIALWFAAPLIEWFFGMPYRGIGEILHWLTIAIPGMALRFAAGSVLMAGGSLWSRAGIEIFGLSVLCIMALLLTPDNSAYSMPVALASAEWSMAITGWLVIRKRLSARHAEQRAT